VSIVKVVMIIMGMIFHYLSHFTQKKIATTSGPSVPEEHRDGAVGK
jgi:hypothetical protein